MCFDWYCFALLWVHVWCFLPFIRLFVCVIACCLFVLCFCVDIFSRRLYGSPALQPVYLKFNTTLSTAFVVFFSSRILVSQFAGHRTGRLILPAELHILYDMRYTSDSICRYGYLESGNSSSGQTMRLFVYVEILKHCAPPLQLPAQKNFHSFLYHLFSLLLSPSPYTPLSAITVILWPTTDGMSNTQPNRTTWPVNKRPLARHSR